MYTKYFSVEFRSIVDHYSDDEYFSRSIVDRDGDRRCCVDSGLLPWPQRATTNLGSPSNRGNCSVGVVHLYVTSVSFSHRSSSTVVLEYLWLDAGGMEMLAGDSSLGIWSDLAVTIATRYASKSSRP